MTTDPLTDEEIRAMGYEPTPEGWVPLKVHTRNQGTDYHGQKRRERSLLDKPTIPSQDAVVKEEG